MQINEGPSLETTIRAITNDIGTPITQLFHTLKIMAKKYVDNHGDLSGWNLVAGGPPGRWMVEYYPNRLQKELYHLVQYSPKHTGALKKFLSGMSTSFSDLNMSLPSILADIGEKLRAPELTANANKWAQNSAAYREYLTTLNDDEDSAPIASKPEKNKLPGQQNAQVDQIVNDILQKLPKQVSGDIRNAIARSQNKLQALMLELQKRNIKPPMGESKVRVPIGEHWENEMRRYITILENKR